MSRPTKSMESRHAVSNYQLTFPCRGDIVSITPKAILFRPSRTRRHGAYVPQLWIPRHAIPEKFPPGRYVFPYRTLITMPEWHWMQNARPDPGVRVESLVGGPA